MLFELHSLNLTLCGIHYNKIVLLHLIVVLQLSSGWQHCEWAVRILLCQFIMPKISTINMHLNGRKPECCLGRVFIFKLGSFASKQFKFMHFLELKTRPRFHPVSWGLSIGIESLQNRLLNVCYVPATSAGLPRVSFSFLFLLLRPLTVLMKQTRQAVCAIKQSIFLDVYGSVHGLLYLGPKFPTLYFLRNLRMDPISLAFVPS